MKHLVELPLEIAKDLYKQGGAFRELAIKAYGLPALVGLPASWSEFEENTSINTHMDINDAVYIKDLHKLNTIEDAESHLSLVRLHIMRDLYRMGWKPNWLNKSPKYTIFFLRRHSLRNAKYRCTTILYI